MDALIGRGVVRSRKKEYDKAIADLGQAIRRDPKNFTAYYNRGLVWHLKREFIEAVNDFDQAIQLSPNNVDALTHRGAALATTGDYDQALTDFDQALRLDPRSVEALCGRGLVWYHKKEYDRAIAEYDEAIRLDPKKAAIYYARGLAWEFKHKSIEAVNDFDQTIRLSPNHVNALTSRGKALAETGEYDKAIADFDQALRLNPRSVDALYCRGLARCFKKEYDKAIADYDEVLRLDPNHATVYRDRGRRSGCPRMTWTRPPKISLRPIAANHGWPIASTATRWQLRPQSAGPAPSMPCWSRRRRRSRRQLPSGLPVRHGTHQPRPAGARGPSRRGQPHRCLGGQGGGDGAAGNFREDLQRDLAKADFCMKIASSRVSEKEYDMAIAAYNEAIRCNPYIVGAYVGRGNARYEKKEYDQAVDDYNQASGSILEKPRPCSAAPSPGKRRKRTTRQLLTTTR